MPATSALEVVTFASDLGWMALLADPARVRRIAFHYPSGPAAIRALDPQMVEHAAIRDTSATWDWLIERLQDYAAGRRVDFRAVRLDLDHLTPFRRAVVKHCRAIGYGKTSSYGELAAASGSPRAARAVGSTMAANRFPLIVPCHRVINASGTIGPYSAPAGPALKLRLLELEGRPRATRRPAAVR